MPLTPGIKWTLEGAKYQKRIMKDQMSLGQIQWLQWLQTTDFCKDKDGNTITIEHGYFHGEKRVGHYLVDGYMKKDGKEYFMEYLGCFWHPGCHIPDSEIPEAHKKKALWQRKKTFLKSKGILIEMRECHWATKMATLENIPTAMGRILNTDTPSTLLEAIKTSKVFGFVVADLSCPDHIRESFGSFLFPPLIQKMELDESHLSPYMLEKTLEEQRKRKFQTVVQTYNGKDMFLLTTLLKFYLELGLVVTNIKTFIQYQPGKCLAPFKDKVYNMRVEATKAKDLAKSTTSKLFGNSG